MIKLKPSEKRQLLPCDCGGEFSVEGLIWQGLHVCEKAQCLTCKSTRFFSLPVNQASVEQYSYDPDRNLLYDGNGKITGTNWFSSRLTSVSHPVRAEVKMNIEVVDKHDDVIILNTLDHIYGHSLLFLLNLQRILRKNTAQGVIVIIQPMFRWLIPAKGISEIWTVDLGFKEFNSFHQDLSDRINNELKRFKNVWLSKGHILPTNENIDIEEFSGIKPYDFESKVFKPRVTFVWREDPDRLWIRNVFVVKAFKKLGISSILIPLHILRTKRFISGMRKRFGEKYIYTVAGFGSSGRFDRRTDDRRVNAFDSHTEKFLCRIYSESELVIGVHGSSMILPTLHSGMAISLMPSKRWGNYAEDICFRETDPRLAAFQRRIIPLNLSLSDTFDIAEDMLKGRESFIRKFIHSDEL